MMAKKRNIVLMLACFAAIVGIAAAITLHAGAEKGASSERDGLVSCPHYSLWLPLSRDYIQNTTAPAISLRTSALSAV